jgi:hypothetical protein
MTPASAAQQPPPPFARIVQSYRPAMITATPHQNAGLRLSHPSQPLHPLLKTTIFFFPTVASVSLQQHGPRPMPAITPAPTTILLPHSAPHMLPRTLQSGTQDVKHSTGSCSAAPALAAPLLPPSSIPPLPLAPPPPCSLSASRRPGDSPPPPRPSA